MGAYEQLLAEGYLEGKTGSGTYAPARCQRNPEHSPVRLNSSVISHPRTAVAAAARLSPRIVWGCATIDPPSPFRPGTPALDHCPFDLWSRLLAKYSRRELQDFCLYRPAGYQPLRAAIAEYISAPGLSCDPEQIIVVSGAQQALDLATRLLLDPGDEVWIEDPGYNGARAAFLGAGVKPVAVPIDNMDSTSPWARSCRLKAR